jgi:phosphoribosylamine---glycine ligase
MEHKKILVIGSGGREHAICRKLLLSPKVSTVYFMPGNAAEELRLETVPIDISNHQAVIKFIKEHNVYFCVVGPEAPLAEGLIDSLQQADLPCFGPTKTAAQLESSKSFAKEVMKRAHVPTAGAEYFSDEVSALEYLNEHKAPIVIKADGLAAGKGVTVALSDEEARKAVLDCFSGDKFGKAGSQVLIEDYLLGREASVMAIINEDAVCMLPISSDYKRALDNNEGPNTGGMGAISPTPVLSEDRLEELKKRIFEPVVSQLKSEGISYKGFLYAGLMVGNDGDFKVIEFNCRLGDPETQSLLLRIEDDFFDLLELAIFKPKDLPNKVILSTKTALTVVLASAGYPATVEDNQLITGLEQEKELLVNVFHAGTKRVEDKVYSKGGRVLGVSALGQDFSEVSSLVYSAINHALQFKGRQYRTDIGRF